MDKQLEGSLTVTGRATRAAGRGTGWLVILLVLALAFAFYSQWRVMELQGPKAQGYPSSFLADLSNASLGMISLVHADSCSVPQGKLLVQLFYEPFCDSCPFQEEIIKEVVAINSARIDVEKACIAFKSDSSYLICSKQFVDGASYDTALSYVCSVNGTTDNDCISTVTGKACADLGIASNCTIENMRAAVRKKQQDAGYTLLEPDSHKLADAYSSAGETNLPSPTVVFNCAFKREGMFNSIPLERNTLTDILDVFTRRL